MNTPESRFGRRSMLAIGAGLSGLYLASKLLPENVVSSASAASTPTPDKKGVFYDDTAMVVSASKRVGTPVSTERKGLVDSSFIDLTAPTFASQCATIAHERDSEISIRNNRLISIFVGFPDQPGGIADLQSGMYHNAYLNNARLVHDFYNNFMGINFSVENKGGYVVANKNWQDYTDGFELFKELDSEGVFPYDYDGQINPIINMFTVSNGDTKNRYGGGGGRWANDISSHFGYALMPGNMLINNDYNFKYVLVHENGHAISLMHNTNIKSVMNPGTYDGLPKLLDSTDIQELCSVLPTITPTPTTSRTETITPTPIRPTPGKYRVFLPSDPNRSAP